MERAEAGAIYDAGRGAVVEVLLAMDCRIRQLEARVDAQALSDPYEDLAERVRASESLNMDKTGWRTAGERRALWGMFTGRHALFRLAPDRHEDHAKGLLGHSGAIVTSDRWWAYTHLPLARQQICWSHLRRDFQAHTEGLAAEKEFGETGLQLCERVFWAWEVFAHTRNRRELKQAIRSLRRTYKPVIHGYAAKRARNKRCRSMARNLLKLWPALWTHDCYLGRGGARHDTPRGSYVRLRVSSVGSRTRWLALPRGRPCG